MVDLYNSILEPVTWFAIQLGWLVVAIISQIRIGGGGALLLLVGTIGGFLAQAYWSFELIFGSDFALYELTGGYDSWGYASIGMAGLFSYALMGVGFFYIILGAAGDKQRVAELELLQESTLR